MSKTKAYKGFDKDLICKGFRYRVGRSYKDEGNRKLKSGFYTHEMPIGVLESTDIFDAKGEMSRFCEVEVEDITKMNETSICGKKMSLKRELDLFGLAMEQIRHVYKNTEGEPFKITSGRQRVARMSGFRRKSINFGDHGIAVSSGDQSAALNSGESGVAGNSGFYSIASVSRKNSIAGNAGGCGISRSSDNWSIACASSTQSVAVATGLANVAAVSDSESAAITMEEESIAASSGFANFVESRGKQSVAGTSGRNGMVVCNGDRSAAVSSCDHNLVEASGKNSIAVGWGEENKCRGAVGSYLVLTEWGIWDGKEDRPLLNAKMVKVDGKTIKANTYYMLQDGKIVKA